ncbi:MAG: DNA-binding domain-containing protein [Pseudomonadota bacterium]|nr:DNA-binding domain-containing protein [Pseudomonadota bacterium]
MPELLDLQRALADALSDGGSATGAAHWLMGEPALLEQRLAIYRSNVAAATAKALGAAYPVIGRVVGDEFFGGLARAYQRRVPSTSGDLFDRGAGFADFLADFAPARTLPYLPDLARLEWAVHRAYGAADAPAWDRQTVAQVAPEQQAAIRFDWAPGSVLIDSGYPMARVWRIHQPEAEEPFEIDWSVGERALVARCGWRVAVWALGAGDAAFVASSLGGAALGVSAALALDAEPGFDLGRLLGRLTTARAICGTLGELGN